MEIPKSIIPLEPYTKDRFQRARLVAERYFTLAHPWLPIISKRLFYDLISNPLKPPHADTVLLLSCMDLVTWLPSDSPTETSPKSLSYAAAKRSLLEDEIIGAFTIQHLHAMILVALYELGHGIYPAAYMSIGACVRYGVALGIHPRNASGLNEPSSTLLEQEERRRAWWAMLILDRFVLLGCPTRSPMAPSPELDDLLPSDDVEYDQGTINRDQLSTLSSQASLKMGMLARLSQACYLLGRTFRHTNDTNVDETFHREEAMQLDRTIRALINLSYAEGAVRRMAVCAQTGICYSALMTLHDPKSSRTDPEHIQNAFAFSKSIAEETSDNTLIFFNGSPISVDNLSPLLSHWAYQAAVIFIRLSRATGEEAAQRLGMLKTKLRVLSRRWKTADAYLQILEAREVMGMDAFVSS
ncbi:hypothetical protein MMC28_010277 [Mycoblastus sanguinarius]|nr:hypothetical protein [Mycoblastus sanguinarius]